LSVHLKVVLLFALQLAGCSKTSPPLGNIEGPIGSGMGDGACFGCSAATPSLASASDITIV
jgi:hypothetical protein